MWALENERPLQVKMSLKTKFDDMAGTKKKSENTSCPNDIHNETKAARNKLGNVGAAVKGPRQSSKASDDLED